MSQRSSDKPRLKFLCSSCKISLELCKSDMSALLVGSCTDLLDILNEQWKYYFLL